MVLEPEHRVWLPRKIIDTAVLSIFRLNFLKEKWRFVRFSRLHRIHLRVYLFIWVKSFSVLGAVSDIDQKYQTRQCINCVQWIHWRYSVPSSGPGCGRLRCTYHMDAFEPFFRCRKKSPTTNHPPEPELKRLPWSALFEIFEEILLVRNIPTVSTNTWRFL